MQREPAGELSAPERLAWPGFVLDLGRGELFDASGRPIELRAQALKVLLILGERAGQVVGKDELMRRVWGDVIVTEDSLVQAVGDIRRVLGDAKHERVRTVPRRGYRLEPGGGPLPAVAIGVRASAPPWRRAPALLGAVLICAAALWAAGAAWRTDGRESAPRSLAVLPFESDGGAEDWFVDGVTSDLTALLSGWNATTVIGRGSTAAYKGRNVDPRAVGRELGVDHVLTGRARRDGDNVRLAVSLIDAATGRAVWSELRDVPRGELQALIGDVAGGVARSLIVEWGDAVGTTSARHSLQPQQSRADDIAMQGMAELLRGVSRENWERARSLFEQALAIDPNSRRGLAGVALANGNLVMWQWTDDRAGAVARAEQALARLDVLAPELLMTRLTHSSVALLRGDWHAAAALGDQLVRHHPNEPAAHHHRCSALLRLARFDESIASCRRALRISPRDSRLSTWQGLIAFNQAQLGHHAEAERWARDSIANNPRVPFYSVVLAVAIAEQGRHDEAVRVMQDAMTRHPAYRQSHLTAHWIAPDARFMAGRDRLLARAAELGLPP